MAAKGKKMTVYIDDAFGYHGNKPLCKLVADSERELHDMADLLGLSAKMFVGNNRIKHYIIPTSMREKAILAGALPVTKIFIRQRFGNYGVEKIK
jgi:hypothetical protein